MNRSKSLAFSTIFAHPYTQRELKRYAWRDERIDRNTLTEWYGLYARDEAKQNAQMRHHAVYESEKRIYLGAQAARAIATIPFVRSVFLCNSAAMGTAKPGSDVDLFIITSADKIWLTRLLVTFRLLRIRRSGTCVNMRICLSFYLAEDALDLTPITIGDDDVYLSYWLATLMPLYDPDRLQETLWQKNHWVRTNLPHAYHHTVAAPFLHATASRSMKRFFQNCLSGKLGNLFNTMARTIQQSKMKRNKQSRQHENNSGVVINDQMLKFHENDRREWYRNAWYAAQTEHQNES